MKKDKRINKYLSSYFDEIKPDKSILDDAKAVARENVLTAAEKEERLAQEKRAERMKVEDKVKRQQSRRRLSMRFMKVAAVAAVFALIIWGASGVISFFSGLGNIGGGNNNPGTEQPPPPVYYSVSQLYSKTLTRDAATETIGEVSTGDVLSSYLEVNSFSSEKYELYGFIDNSEGGAAMVKATLIIEGRPNEKVIIVVELTEKYFEGFGEVNVSAGSGLKSSTKQVAGEYVTDAFFKDGKVKYYLSVTSPSYDSSEGEVESIYRLKT